MDKRWLNFWKNDIKRNQFILATTMALVFPALIALNCLVFNFVEWLEMILTH